MQTTVPTHHVSEVVRIREQIAAEHLSGQLGLYGLSDGAARHDFITAKQERIGVLHEELEGLVGDEALALVVETLASIPDTVTRSDILAVVRHELSDDAERELLCHALQEAWKAVDLFQDRFGDEQTRKLLFAPPPPVRELPPS